MNTKKICSGCGQPLPPDAPAGLCPHCLLKSDAPTVGSDPSQPHSGLRQVPIPGETFGDYRIIRLLGKGGMGEVYEAEHIPTSRRLALKVMSHALASEADRKRFLREGRLAASVNHPNVVYIYGSEEINGMPVIAMELVSAGTLKDLLKAKGPLPIAEAVEAVLQMVSGLEAAQSAGVLHRDIKPANCFIDSDNTVKVGDFGLSVSTLARGESLLTATGAVLGTPAYASPEQLRGEELDVRSDVYSVGATLYHLLTGQTPFSANDFVKLITEVLDKEPQAPVAIRADIPNELARVILKCLHKDRKARFQSYEQLRDALLPFAARQTEPAVPSRRFLAGLLDELLAYGPSLMFVVYWSFDPLDKLARERTWSAALVWLPFYLWYLLYYTISEGLWGAAVGKRLLNLKVIALDGHNPGLLRAWVRTLLYMAPFTLPSCVLMAVTPLEKVRAASANQDFVVTDWWWLVLLCLLFVTMRKRNGYAAVHDFASRTRVVVRPRSQVRPVLKTADLELPPVQRAAGAVEGSQFGPYESIGVLWAHQDQQLVGAFDPVLRRNIWIHLRKDNAGSVDAARRTLSRPARLRWLAGGTVDGQNWDAFEAPEGSPLLSCPRQSWGAVRFYLLDLAEECAAALAVPGASLETSLQRIWITRQGRALMLDFPCPGSNGPVDVPVRISQWDEAQRLLAQVASSALRRGEQEGDTRSNPTIPLHARSFLDALALGTFEKFEYVLGNLQSLVTKPADINRGRRAASLFLLPALILMSGLLLALTINFDAIRAERAWANLYPGTPSFPAAARLYLDYLQRVQDGEDAKEDVALAERYLAGKFGFLSTNATFWTQAELGEAISPEQRQQLREAVSKPTPAPEVVKEAEDVISSRVQLHRVDKKAEHIWIMIVWWIACTALWAMIDAIGILAVKQTPIFRLFSLVVVDRQGEPASRWRLLSRWALVWLPAFLVGIFGLGAVLLAFVTYGSLAELGQVSAKAASILRTSSTVMTSGALLLWLAGVGFALWRPQRGLHDRLAGTWLVSR